MLALVCLRHDIWETSADIPHWWCISRQLWVVPDWLCREKNLLQPQRKTTKIYHLGSEPHQYGISTYVLSFLMEISGGVMKIMSATFSGYSNRNAAEKGQLNLHCTSLGLPMHCNAGQQSSPTAQFRVTIIIIMLLAWIWRHGGHVDCLCLSHRRSLPSLSKRLVVVKVRG